MRDPAASGPTGSGLEVRTPAKVNLGLEVRSRRPDGYHDLATVLAPVDLWDTVRLAGDPGGEPGRVRLSCSDPALPVDDQNLVVRAVRLLGRDLGERLPPLRIHLTKRIPAGRGLGGGSSDAAAALLGVNRLFRLGASSRELGRIAARIGMDVPFFLEGGTALCVGRGDLVFPLADQPELSLVLLIPDFAVSTPEAYRGLRLREAPPAGIPAVNTPGAGPAATIAAPSGPRARAQSRARRILRSGLRNDLEASSALPGSAGSDAGPGGAVRELRRALDAAGALASAMSGSGSAVFGVFSDCGAAARAAKKLDGPSRVAGARAFATRVISRTEHRRALAGDPADGAWPSG